jgi:hypothetical protein
VKGNRQIQGPTWKMQTRRWLGYLRISTSRPKAGFRPTVKGHMHQYGREQRLCCVMLGIIHTLHNLL